MIMKEAQPGRQTTAGGTGPRSENDHRGRRAAAGLIWFPHPADHRIWCRNLGWEEAEQVALSSKSGQLLLRVVLGLSKPLPNLPPSAPRIIYLPPGGVSDMAVNRRLRDMPLESRHLVRLLHFEDLGHLGQYNEPAPYTLWTNALSRAGRRPFLAIADEPDSQRAVQEWIDLVVASSTSAAWLDLLALQLFDAERELQRFLRQRVPAGFKDRAGLGAALLWRDTARDLNGRLLALERDLGTTRSTLERLRGEIDRACWSRYQQTGERIYGLDFAVTLGEELLPGLRALLPDLQSFADSLKKSQVEDLRLLGIELATRLENRLPTLALVGTFSAGKTTLLNALLLGSSAKRAFRTKVTANTAIVSEIYGARRDEAERVLFRFRDKIEQILCDAALGDLQLTDKQNIIELLRLIDAGVIHSPQLGFLPPEGNKRAVRAPAATPGHAEARRGGALTQVARLFTGEGVEETASLPYEIPKDLGGVREYLRRLTYRRVENLPFGRLKFTGEIDRRRLELLLQRGLIPRDINLSADDGWARFQGDGAWAETFAASLLVEVAEIRLRNPLLELTTVADTPGFGSYNDQHDLITSQYISRADGFIVLLPTNEVNSYILHKMLHGIRDKLAIAHKNDPALGLQTVAFVVNCFARYGQRVDEEIIGEYEQVLCKTFGLTAEEWRQRQSNPQRANFFVVRLKHAAEGELAETLYGRPSLAPLKRWIEALFCSGAYLERFNLIRATLNDDWRSRQRAIANRLRTESAAADVKAAQAARIRRFRESELRELTQIHLNQIRDFRETFHAGSDSLRARVEKYLDDYATNASNLKKEIVGEVRKGLKIHFTSMNTRLQHFKLLNPPQSWADEVGSRLRSLDVSAPALETPHPGAQSPSWHPDSQLSMTAVDEKFDQISAGWPNPFGRMREFFKRPFVPDMRQKMARDVRDPFWEQQYKLIWPSLELYLKRCEEFIQAKAREVAQQCEQREAELSTGQAGRSAALQDALTEFAQLEPDRRGLLERLTAELTRDEDALRTA